MEGYVDYFWLGYADEEPTGIAVGVGKRDEAQALAWAKREVSAEGLEGLCAVYRRRQFYRVANEIECRCRRIDTNGCDGAWVEATRRPTKHGDEFYVFDLVPTAEGHDYEIPALAKLTAPTNPKPNASGEGE